MDELTEWEEAQLRLTDFTPRGLKIFKALFALGITIPVLLCVYGLFSYWVAR